DPKGRLFIKAVGIVVDATINHHGNLGSAVRVRWYWHGEARSRAVSARGTDVQRPVDHPVRRDEPGCRSASSICSSRRSTGDRPAPRRRAMFYDATRPAACRSTKHRPDLLNAGGEPQSQAGAERTLYAVGSTTGVGPS